MMSSKIDGLHLVRRAATGAVALAILACAGGEPAARSQTGSAPWRAAAVWDDGNAEFCAYEVDWSRYGNLFPGRALLILVKEPWAPDLEVKADHPRPDGFDVLKLNHIRDVATGIYTYHQMASVFLRRDSGEMRKLSVMNSEGCGISTAHLVDGVINTRSYFDGQGEASAAYPEGALAEEGLAASLRDYVAGEIPATLEVVPSFMTGRLPAPEARSYRLSRRQAEREGPEGPVGVVELRLEAGDRWLSYAFDVRPPHLLVHHAASDGTEYRLAKCERIPYWSLNHKGGESWLPEPVR